MPQTIQKFELNFLSVPKFQAINKYHLDEIHQFKKIPEDVKYGIKVAAHIFPFRANEYVINELIDWNNWNTCPIFRLIFPQKEMLNEKDFNILSNLISEPKYNKQKLEKEIRRIRSHLNPHPGGQKEYNTPLHNGKIIKGIQHKYKETVLYFPAQGQTCHSYCSFCFRWAQFIGDKELKFSSKNVEELVSYLKIHPEVTDVIFTGGDPLVMKSKILKIYIQALLIPELSHIKTIRIGSKSLTFWPYRFVTDDDSKELLEIFRMVVTAGKHLAYMAHFNHWKELRPKVVKRAIQLIRDTGAEIRSQSPLLKNINDDPNIWATLWKDQVNLGIIPYYMFIERDTGAKHYFEVPLAKAWNIYKNAQKQISGICKTAKGPSMSTESGKIEIQGISEINDEKVFILRFIQGRNPNWLGKPFFANYDVNASWINDLHPAFNAGEKFFFEREL